MPALRKPLWLSTTTWSPSQGPSAPRLNSWLSPSPLVTLLVSYLNKAPGAGIGAAVKTLGFGGLWQGLGPRIIMIGTLTALQWFIYDGVKVQLRLPRPPPPEMPASLKAKMAAAQS